MSYSVAITGNFEIRLPQWGRAFWQDPNDGELFLAFASGGSEVHYITSADSGNSWSNPSYLFPVDDFQTHNNFDVFMDRRGHIHCGFRYNDSGCYQFVGKQGGGGWTLASGSGPIGFNVAGDSGSVKGFDGSLVVQEAPNSSASEGSVKFPAVKIAAKASGDVVDAYILGDPYTGTPTIESISSFDSANFVGSGGGFPTIATNSAPLGSGPTSEFFVYSEPLSTLRGFSKQFGTYFDSSFFSTEVSGDFSYAPNMAIGSGFGVVGSDACHLVCTASGQALFMSAGDGFGGYFYQRVTQTHTEDQSNPPDATTATNGTDVQVWRKAARNEPPSGVADYLPMDSGIAPTGQIYGVGPSQNTGSGVPIAEFPGGGTHCDFHINNNQELILYFLAKDWEGRQSIARVKGYHDFSEPKWIWPDKNHIESGVKYVASVSKDFTGGYNNILFWGGFKAAKHPTEPGDGSNKGEFLVTQGWTSTYPSGGSLVVWNVAESPHVVNPYARPTYHLDYLATSGSAGINVFQQISKLEGFFFTSHQQQVNEIFDGDLNTFGRVRNGYVIEVELDQAREISRLEMLSATLTRPPEMTVSGSFDGENWTRVLTKPSGRLSTGFNERSPLYKFSTVPETIVDRQNDPSEQPVNQIEPFVAKYIRFTFENEFGQNISSSIYDLRLYGPGATEPEIIRYNQDHSFASPHDIRTNLLRKNQAKRTESFAGIRQGGLPPGFRTYGDFEWRVVGSGDAVRSRTSPFAPEPEGADGKVPANSGIWGYYQLSRGFRDGFSLRSEAIGDASGLGSPIGNVPVGGIQPGHSGVVEVDVFLTDDDVDLNDSTTARSISFRMRTDTQKDDRVEFWTIAPNALDSDSERDEVLRETWEEANNWDADDFTGGNSSNYKEHTYQLANIYGRHTLRWVYHKGAYDSEAEQASSFNFGAAWVDMVSGLDASPSNYVKGYLRGEAPFESGAVHGYLNAKAGQNVHGYTIGAPQTTSIHGYLISAVSADAMASINGYVFANTEGQIYGVTIGGSGLSTIPTGAIHGFVAAPQSGGLSSVHGYVEGDWGRSIHGYVHGRDDIDAEAGDKIIHGYIYAIDGSSSIHGVVNGATNIVSEQIHGFVESSFGIGDQVIHGYLFAPSGATSSRKGMTLGWNGGPDFFRAPQHMIHGFMQAPVDSGSSQVHGYILANLPLGSIYGYLGSEALVASGGGLVGGGPGTGGSSTSNVPGGQNWVHGFVAATGQEQVIHGYVMGPPGGTAEIKGYVLAGAADTTIHGYLAGQEDASESIHGFVSGIGFVEESINGYAFAVSGIENSTIYGITQGAMIPTSNILGRLIGYESGTNDTSDGRCLSHNFPLVSIPVIVIPSSYFN